MCLESNHKNQDKINIIMRGRRGHTDSSRVMATNGDPLGLHPSRGDNPVVLLEGMRTGGGSDLGDILASYWNNNERESLSLYQKFLK